jgi:putative Mg2+ transporter-C (MgtC) family protein
MEILTESAMVINLVVAVLLGSLVGVQRSIIGKMAGMRTFALVSLGSALFVSISRLVSSQFIDLTNFDPLRVASQVVVGIGFLGAGLIIFRGENVTGLTTAAGMWVAAGVGMACGYGLYLVGITATVLTLLIFTLLWHLEAKVKNTSGN